MRPKCTAKRADKRMRRPANKIQKCHKKTIVVCPRKRKKRCVIVKKKIMKATCPRSVIVDSTFTLSPFRRICTELPNSTSHFFNGLLISIPAGFETTGPANPYPSTITVTGLTGPIIKVTATLNDLTHTFPDDIDILLVGPDGITNTILMSDAGGEADIASVTLTFDDLAANFLPDDSQLVSGTFKPSNYQTPPEDFPVGAPPPSAIVGLSNFNGMNPNGTWKLFIADDGEDDTGFISSWALSITTPGSEECIFTPL